MKFLTPLALLVLTSCFHLKKPAHPAFHEPVLIDAAFINSHLLQSPASARYFYELYKNELAWSDSTGLTREGSKMLSFIRHVEEKGLDTNDYHLAELSLMKDSLSKVDRKTRDVFLTDAYISLFHDLASSRLDSVLSHRKDRSQLRDSSAVSSLVAALRSRSVIESLLLREPSSKNYVAMRDTLSALVLSLATDSTTLEKKRRLVINIERIKSAGVKPTRYLRVNIPSLAMSVIENDSVILESNVIVGKPVSRTPELESVIKSFIIYPYWHVPRSIATKEILPLVQADSNYLASHNFEVLDRRNEVVPVSSVDWSTLSEDYFPYTLRQREGHENSLGIIKFVFNNSYGVYLHDTNARRLFKKEKRALSHGCVRVQKAVDLAHYLVKDDSVYTTPDDLDQYLSLRQRVQIKIVNPLPVFIEYFTCEFKDGKMKYYEDIYLKDEEIANALWPAQQPNL